MVGLSARLLAPWPLLWLVWAGSAIGNDIGISVTVPINTPIAEVVWKADTGSSVGRDAVEMHYNKLADQLYIFTASPAGVNVFDGSSGVLIASKELYDEVGGVASRSQVAFAKVHETVDGVVQFIVAIILDDTILSNPGGRLVRLEPDFTETWSVTLDLGIINLMTVDNRPPVFGGPIIDPTGTRIYTNLGVANGQVSQVVAFRAQTGDMLWNVPVEGYTGGLLQFGNKLYAGRSCGMSPIQTCSFLPTLYEWDTSTGEMTDQWIYGDCASNVNCGGFTNSAPALSNDRTFMILMHTFGGPIRFNTDAPISNGPVYIIGFSTDATEVPPAFGVGVNSGSMFVATRNCAGQRAASIETGETFWVFCVGGSQNAVTDIAVVEEDRVYYVKGSVLVLPAETDGETIDVIMTTDTVDGRARKIAFNSDGSIFFTANVFSGGLLATAYYTGDPTESPSQAPVEPSAPTPAPVSPTPAPIASSQAPARANTPAPADASTPAPSEEDESGSVHFGATALLAQIIVGAASIALLLAG